MSKTILSLLLCSALMLNLACSTTKQVSQNSVTSPVKSIGFGNGGGVTGQVKSFYLNADGKMYKQGDTAVLNTVNYDKVVSLFNNAEKLIDYKHDNPGNIYQYIQIITATDTNRVVWRIGDTEVSQDAYQIYKSLSGYTVF